MKRALSLALVMVVATLVAGCKSGTAGKVISVQILPTSISAVVSTTVQFTATVTDTFVQDVTWSVVGGSANGTISASGLYTAPTTVPTPAQVTVMAVSQKDKTRSTTAVVTVTATATPPTVTVTVSPDAPLIANYGTQLFAAVVSGTANTGVTWQVNGVTGGSRSLGFISAAGLYVAPGRVPTASDGAGNVTTTTFLVTAVSQADLTASGSASVTIIPGNQNRQPGAVQLGTSGSNVKDTNTSGTSLFCCGGTLGSLVTRNGTQYILSNTHVLARSDAAAVGEAITQPGLIEVNCDLTQTATVANLTQFANLETESHTAASTNVDAAIAQIVSGRVDPSGNILYLGANADLNGVPTAAAPHAGSGVAAMVNMAVAKSGRSTGLTCSAVSAVNTSTNIGYTKNCDGTGTPFTVTYKNQVVVSGDFGAPGDSGSLIVSQNTADPVALLYGGSDADAVGNPVTPVLNFFASGGNALTFVGGAAHAVIGCSLPNAPLSVSKTVPAAMVTADAMKTAVAARDARSAELLAHPEVQAVGVGASYDNPAEGAIVFFVTKGQPHADIPAQIDGVRTRIVEGDLFPRRGAISAVDTVANEQSVAAVALAISTISQAEYERAKVVHDAHAEEWMQQAGVQGVGITSSVDSTGEAALMIFVIRGAEHRAIPAVIDGLRTRVRESSRFRAGTSGIASPRACRLPVTTARTRSSASKASPRRRIPQGGALDRGRQ
jgi:hypothetical protein